MGQAGHIDAVSGKIHRAQLGVGFLEKTFGVEGHLEEFGQILDRVGKDGAGQIDEVWRGCDILISPESSGGGVSVKLAEAVYNRKPVLARKHAVRGLGLEADPAIVLLDGPQEWVEFLNSGAAMALARRSVSEKVAMTFAAETHRDAVQQFVRAILSGAVQKRQGTSPAG